MHATRGMSKRSPRHPANDDVLLVIGRGHVQGSQPLRRGRDDAHRLRVRGADVAILLVPSAALRPAGQQRGAGGDGAARAEVEAVCGDGDGERVADARWRRVGDEEGAAPELSPIEARLARPL